MSVEAVIARIAEIDRALNPRPATAAAGTDFAQLLRSQSVAGVPSFVAGAPGGGGSAVASFAAGEVGVTEQPPGSNDAPRIAEFRTATAGSGVGPWCAYFVSWAAKQAGTPLGEAGQGFGSVDALYAWAQRTGRAEGSSYTPKPGDLIVWDEHIGIVESVAPDGTVSTIEGNSSDMVARRQHAPGSMLGFVKMS